MIQNLELSSACRIICGIVMPQTPLIIKADGRREPFDADKLRSSLKRAGASSEAIEKVVNHVDRELEDGITTHRIYQHAFEVLRRSERQVAARYSLRRALLLFGPTGFPFEMFLSELFKARGYRTKTRQLLQGSCVAHEIDVLAWNEEKLMMIEAKFHNAVGEKSDLKTALYVKARYDDLIEREFEVDNRRRQLTEGWLVTNTKFTLNAVQYALCSGLTLLGWNYPELGNLRQLVEDERLHPITCLTTLSARDKNLLLSRDIVLCRTLAELGVKKLEEMGITLDEARLAVSEVRRLFGSQ